VGGSGAPTTGTGCTKIGILVAHSAQSTSEQLFLLTRDTTTNINKKNNKKLSLAFLLFAAQKCDYHNIIKVCVIYKVA
jgi:hypothetical protein